MECGQKTVYCEDKKTMIRYERDLMIICLTNNEIPLLINALKNRATSLDLTLDERALLCKMAIKLRDVEVDEVDNYDPDKYVAEHIKKALSD